MKKLNKIIAGVAAMTLAAGIAVVAAPSPNAGTAESAAITQVLNRYEGTTTNSSLARNEVVNVAVEGSTTPVRITGDYSAVTDSEVVAVVSTTVTEEADQEAVQTRLTEVAAAEPDKTTVGPFDIDFLKDGIPTNDFGTFTVQIGVDVPDNTVVNVYIYYEDTTSEVVAVSVANGQLNIELTQAAQIYYNI